MAIASALTIHETEKEYPMNLISMENITKSYSERILLDDISLGINDGDKIGIVGLNGVGKSTLLKIIAGIERQFCFYRIFITEPIF